LVYILGGLEIIIFGLFGRIGLIDLVPEGIGLIYLVPEGILVLLILLVD